MKLNLLIIGAQKSGTSALHQFLSQHPQICMSQEKELMLFNREVLSQNDLSAAESSFPANSPARYYGESTPYYMFEPPVLKRIAAYNPDVRLIVVLRNPVDRLTSQYAMNVRDGATRLPLAIHLVGEPILYNFDRLLRATKIPANWRCRLIRNANYRFDGPAGLNGFPSVLLCRNYMRRGFYDQHLKQVYRLFPRQNVLCVTTEDLERRHDGTLRKIFEFLGVDSAVRVDQAYVNRHEGFRREISPFLLRYVRWRLARHVRELERLLGCAALEAWATARAN
jgi:Sulfotransferase domain